MSIITEAPKASSSAQPEWVQPLPEVEEPVLKVYNSLTRSKDIFIPKRGKRVDWYNCGPTVYDASHMGHARNYLTQDIVRRILRDYFGYDVNFVMNVTDIDDKIILRARESHLIAHLRTSHPTLSPALIQVVQEAFQHYLHRKVLKNLPSPVEPSGQAEDVQAYFQDVVKRDTADAAFAAAAREKEEKWGLYLASMGKASKALDVARERVEAGDEGKEEVEELVDGAADVLGPYLGDTQGNTIQDPIAISRQLASYWEDRFFADMARLRVIPPDSVTRVSEYVPEIVAFTQQIIDNGFAYEAGGSVWFDVAKFEGAKQQDESGLWAHEYAKLQPGSKGNRKLLDEGEGALTASSGKRQPSDFALWKGTKPGEPAWPSPWGNGRPGWHIECSVMASAILGKGMDIHSGGVDLMFPHHDNELAQSEAYHGCRQWVNYFLHTGHLHIEGLKMSKSLKNFITIDQALDDYTARQLRMAFMLQTWNAKMDFKKDLISDVKTKEETFDNFFNNVNARLRQSRSTAFAPPSSPTHNYAAPEAQLTSHLHAAQHDFRLALCDSFNTPQALNVLLDLVGKVNVYFASRGKDSNLEPVRVVAEWVTRMLRMFGLGEGAGYDGQIGWGKAAPAGSQGRDKDGAGEEGGAGASAAEVEEQVDKYVKALSGFRDEIRKLAIGGASNQDVLALCDRFRDVDLVNLGVQLDDGQGADGGALYKLVDPAILLRQREEKAALLADKAAKKAAAAAEAESKRIALLERGKAAPGEMFKPPYVPEGTYSEWDAAGLPTKDGEGKEVSKSAAKKWVKEQKAQEKLHGAYLAWKAEGK